MIFESWLKLSIGSNVVDSNIKWSLVQDRPQKQGSSDMLVWWVFFILFTLTFIIRGKKRKGSDDESDKEDLVADIFGGSSDEEEFEGFAEADVEETAKKKEKKTRMCITLEVLLVELLYILLIGYNI